MGSKFFKPSTAAGGAVSGSNLNMEARAIGSSSYMGQKAGGRAAKDIGAAQAIYKAGSLKPTAKDAAADAPGPKKV